MAFRNLTNIGKEYLATRLANQLPVKFTKAKIGNGSVPLATDPAQTTDLYGLKKQVTILKTIQEQNSIKLTVQITNDEINEGFYLKEIGIYVDDNGKEVLYWYCNEDNSQYINAQTDTPLSFEVDIVMEVTNINSTVVEWTGKDTWVNKTLLNEEMAKKLNNGNLPATFTNAETILKALQGNTGIKFDENLLYLNDVGTKKKGLCYLDKLTDGIFECIQETTTTVNNATYFKNFSNKENSDRLSNLIKFDNTSIKNIIFKTYDWYSPEDNDEPVTIPIGIDFKNILMLSIGATNGKMPHGNIIRDNNIILGYNNYWIFPQNAGHGKIYAIFEI